MKPVWKGGVTGMLQRRLFIFELCSAVVIWEVVFFLLVPVFLLLALFFCLLSSRSSLSLFASSRSLSLFLSASFCCCYMGGCLLSPYSSISPSHSLFIFSFLFSSVCFFTFSPSLSLSLFSLFSLSPSHIVYARKSWYNFRRKVEKVRN